MTPTDATTDLFLKLDATRVLDAVEAAGLECAPVCHPLNSFENRVYDVLLRDGTRVIAKFYRPGRWTEAQILEEHAFLADLAADEVPVCGVRAFPDGTTLKRIEGIWYGLYDRGGGRAPEEIDADLAERLGMMAARIHNVGARRDAEHRLRLGGDAWVREPVAWMVAHGVLPGSIERRYVAAAGAIADLADARLAGVPVHRIHGDFHAGNLLLREGGLSVLDFDDMVTGPAVQDLWLALPGRDADALRNRSAFLEGYGRFRSFDRAWLDLVEPLRGLRIVHHAAWLARRWHDPIFPATWPQFGTDDFWETETSALEDVLDHAGRGPDAPAPVAAEQLTNADLFWDWQESSPPHRD
jgi:Ser/Thr protein kinase RdoA (MazF antagonist)